MDYLDNKIGSGLNEGEDSLQSTAALESQLIAIEDRLSELGANGDPTKVIISKLQMARVKIGLDKKEESWSIARALFDDLIINQQWELATDACDIMFLSEHENSLAALGHGIWLSVTYPIDPELSLGLLQHIVDETADDADGAAVAAATALYIVDLRAEGKQKENLGFFANQLLAAVARRHSDVESKEQFDFWIEKMELNDPSKFLIRLRNVVDVLVQDEWWIDREKLHQALPVN